jgi:hypothetical protein
MRRLITALVLLAICLPLSAADTPSSAPPASLPPREPNWELFLDDHIIERSTGFRRVLHHPEPRGVVLEPDLPWETQGLSILYVGWRKDGKLECYYRVHGKDIPGDTTAYAVSDDGIHWEKPVLGIVDGPNGKENNLLPADGPGDVRQRRRSGETVSSGAG